MFFSKKASPSPLPVPLPLASSVSVQSAVPEVASPSVPRPSLAPIRLKRSACRLQRELNTTTRLLRRIRLTKTTRYEPPLVEPAPISSVPCVPVPAPTPSAATAPALDASSIQALASTSPAFVELQYEVLDLRHQLQSLQVELARLKAASEAGPVPVIASHVLVQDAEGQVVASLTPDGVLACSSISFLSKH